MEIREVLEEFVEKLEEIAFRKKEFESKVVSLGETIGEHLIKIALFPDSQSVKHWQKEILVKLKKIDRLILKNGKKLKANKYFEYLYETPWTPLIAIRNEIKGLIAIYEDLNPCLDGNIEDKAKKVEEKMMEFFAEVSKDLSKDVFDLLHYKNKLEEFRQYFLEDCDGSKRV